MKRIPKGVSFNIDDPFESKLLDYALKQGAFSKYVKRLITMDMVGDSVPSDIKKPKNEVVYKEHIEHENADSFI